MQIGLILVTQRFMQLREFEMGFAQGVRIGVTHLHKVMESHRFVTGWRQGGERRMLAPMKAVAALGVVIAVVFVAVGFGGWRYVAGQIGTR